MSQSEWFEKWFQEDYLVLYSNRNSQQAESQVEALLSVVSDYQESDFFLDLGCGTGRHLKALQARHANTIGMDLSPVLLMEAAKNSCNNIVRGDFRALPFKSESFQIVCSFFSSFGYFQTREDDWAFFKKLTDLVKVKGYLFWDLPNGPYAVSHLPPDNEVISKGTKYLQKRRWDGERIIKKIEITRPDGSIELQSEKLRLFSHSEVVGALESAGFKVLDVFGNEHGDKYDRTKSPRMSFVAQKVQ